MKTDSSQWEKKERYAKCNFWNALSKWVANFSIVAYITSWVIACKFDVYRKYLTTLKYLWTNLSFFKISCLNFLVSKFSAKNRRNNLPKNFIIEDLNRSFIFWFTSLEICAKFKKFTTMIVLICTHLNVKERNDIDEAKYRNLWERRALH